MKPERPRARRPLHAAVLALAAATGLAACGGGSSIDIDDGGGVITCLSTQGGGSGYALGSCFSTTTSVFQPVIDDVVVTPGVVTYPSQDTYILDLVFPAELQAQQSLDGVTAFVQTDQPSTDSRNIIGVLRGQAYERDSDTSAVTLTPPYVALADFHRPWDYSVGPASTDPLMAMSHASFGTWEKYANTDFNDGFLGVWYAPRGLANDGTWPSGEVRIYRGYAVGIIAPSGPGASFGVPGLPLQAYGFSAPIDIEVDGTGRIAVGQLGAVTISYNPGSGLVTAILPIKPIVLSGADGSSPGLASGTVATAATGTGANGTGEYEAGFFSLAGALPGREVAGRLRFTTDTGLVGVASFGTVLQ